MNLVLTRDDARFNDVKQALKGGNTYDLQFALLLPNNIASGMRVFGLLLSVLELTRVLIGTYTLQLSGTEAGKGEVFCAELALTSS